MISFRYHVSSLVAVLLALGAGVALGSGPLQRDEQGSTANTGGPAGTSVTAEEEQVASFNDAFAASLQAGTVAGRLEGRPVTLLLLPGAPQPAVSVVTQALGQAGATVAGSVRLGDELVDPAKRQLVDEMGGQLEAESTKVTMETDSGTYERIGTLLAYAVGTTTGAGDAIDDQGKGILAGLSTAGLVTTDETMERRGNLVVIVAGPPGDDEQAAQGTASIVLSLARAIDARTGGVVLVGPASAADPSGVLAAVRSDAAAAKLVSTVDSADHPAGAIVTVLALEEQVAQKAGQYGGGPGAIGPRPGVPNAG